MNEEDKKPRIVVVGSGTHATTLRSVLAQNAHRLGAVPEVIVKDVETGEELASEVVESRDGTRAVRILEPILGRHISISSAVAQILADESCQPGGEEQPMNKHDRRRRWWEVSKRDRRR